MDPITKKLCKVSQLTEGEGKRFIINGEEVAIFKVGDKIHAVSNICPHQHPAAIYSGFIEEGFVVCPIHGWRFELETGNKDTGRPGLRVFPVEIKDGYIYVTVEEETPHWKW
jgi:nitrite reductase/ring-hydroxylating ferredoxin subunit